jgi:hypothetical protein
VVTDRDRSVVRWVAVIGAASAQDVMALFRLGRTVGYGRLRALVDHGLLSRQRLLYGEPVLCCTRRPGTGWHGRGYRSSSRCESASPRRGIGRSARASLSSWSGRSLWRCGGSRGCARRSSRPAAPSRARSLASGRMAGRGCGGRISCCFPMRRCRWRSRSSCRSRARAGWRRSARRGRAAESSAIEWPRAPRAHCRPCTRRRLRATGYARATARHAFCPPNPNEFDSTSCVSGASRGPSGT